MNGFNAFMRGEMSEEAVMAVAQETVDPHFEYHWHSRGGMFPDQPQELRGVPAFVSFWTQIRGAFVDLVSEPLEFVEASDHRVLTPMRTTGRGRESGVPVDGQHFQVWTFRDGKVLDMELFVRRADALEAAGLRE
jgi:ketosteroid isomerase-like protein